MAHRKALTQAQLQLLNWIAEGRPDGVVEGDSYRISVAALRSRGLVTTKGHGPTWTATITRAGADYLGRSVGPSAPLPRQGNGSVTEALVADLVNAGGSLRLRQKQWDERDGVDWERRALLAQQHNKVPFAKRIVVSHLSSSEIQLDLIDEPGAHSVAPPAALEVPNQVRRYHPAVAELRDLKDHHEVSRTLLPRALRLLHVLATEAEHRGHEVHGAYIAKTRQVSERWSGPKHGHLCIVADDEPTLVRVIEDGLQSRSYFDSRHSEWDARTHQWRPPALAEYEAKANGRLRIELVSYNRAGRQSKWADGRLGLVEERLGDVLWEVGLRGADRRAARQEARRRAIDEQARWESAMEGARRDHREDQLARALDTQVDAWQRAERIRAYCDAAAVRHGEDAQTVEWLAWARAHADGIDPLAAAPGMPAHPEEVTPDELRPFTGRFDPYRPPHPEHSTVRSRGGSESR